MNARLTYKPGDDVGVLEPWPFTGEASDYTIVRGSPQASGRIDGGGPGHTWRLGIWRCTEGAFECNEASDELQTVLSGRVRVVSADGSANEFGPGMSFFTRRGERVTWDILEDVTKVFYSLNQDGF